MGESTVTQQQSNHQPSAAVAAFLRRPKQLWIDGAWVDSVSGRAIEVYDPATGKQIDSVQAGVAADVDRAVAAASAAFESAAWRGLRPADREALLWRLSDLVARDADILAELESLDNGKPVGLARMVDVNGAVEYLRYMAGWATKIHGRVIHPSFAGLPGAEITVNAVRDPVGVVGQIVPWNFPLLMAVWKLAPALAAGCTCVLKPAEQTSLTALYLAELVAEAGFPAGVVNVVTGLGHEAGAALVAHPDVAKIAFTGSTEVGKIIGRGCMDTMKRVSLELGGKSPVIVCADADLDKAIPGAAMAIFFNAGQVCTAGSRLYVDAKIYEPFMAGIAAFASSIKVGPGWAADTQMGPLVSAEQQARVLSYIEIGKAEGGELLVGGEAQGDEGYFVKPTILANVNPTMRVVREEIFGPVVVAQKFATIDEAVKLANSSDYGLGASVWSEGLSTAHRIASRLQAGSVWVNCHNAIDPAVPFGGFKQSGLGREHGEEAINLHTEPKSIWYAV